MQSLSTMESMGMVQEPKVVVGLDFGTTFSGFAYALRADPDNVYTFYDWPMQAEGGGLPYCKTQTSLLYAEVSGASDHAFELRGWGWPAYVKYKSMNSVADSSQRASGSGFSEIQNLDVHLLPEGRGVMPSASYPSQLRVSGGGHVLTLFKLHLATKDNTQTKNSTSVPILQPGITVKRAIKDFLSEISKFILQEVRNKFGAHITLQDVQWCLTVPAIWDEQAKKEMRHCSEIAGLVQGPKSKPGTGSPHPLKVFIEPEAASIYCQMKLKDHTWSKGDKFLVVDCGGGTVDLVLHEKLGGAMSVSVREVQESSGDLCGGSFVNEEFFSFLRRKISCFKRFEKEYPATALAFRQDWEKIKNDYAGEIGVVYVELPPKLAAMWEEEDAITPVFSRGNSNYIESYDELRLSNEDMKSIFDPVVNRILQLVEEKMVPDLQAILVVGGFSASPYLMRRIRETFDGRVAAIASPPNPGSAVCCGAVTMGIRSDTVVSRISKKTYGLRVVTPFIRGVHPESSMARGDLGRLYSRIGFSRHVSKGDEVHFDECVKKDYHPISKEQTRISIDLYSSDRKNATYTTDPGMRKEGTFTVNFPSFHALGFLPSVEVAMYFGRSEIQVTATGKNFNSEKREMLPVKFDRDSIF